jgi:ParB family transcriptional regulator, chromosome partitioning protein
MTADKPRRLGRGLEALIAAAPAVAPSVAEGSGVVQNALRQLPIAQIRANPYQPRKEFRPEELADLESSLRATGLLQPITVRPAPNGIGFELIAGERRLRAATRLGWTEIPALVKQIDDRTLLTLALVENLQRADLNAIEEAEGYQRLIEEFSLTQQEVAEVVGKDRSTIANAVRLLGLPPSVRTMVTDGHLTPGHARALLALGSERSIVEVANQVVARGLSVRDVERQVREAAPQKSAPTRQGAGRSGAGADLRTAEVRHIEDQLRSHLQTDVQLTLVGKEKGTIRIPFYSADDLERVLDMVLGSKRHDP